MAWNGRGVALVDSATDDLEAFAVRHRATTGRPAYRADALPPVLADKIERRLAGDRRVRIDLDLRGHSDFEQDVWRKALEIPRGEVRPYGWVAAEIGRPKAVRAVGTALGHNPVPLIVPVPPGGPDATGRSASTRSAGRRTSGRSSPPRGSTRRRWRTRRGVASGSSGCATTHIVCWPSCHTGRRMLPRNRRPFRSLSDAAVAGYRPCKVCRPVAVPTAA